MGQIWARPILGGAAALFEGASNIDISGGNFLAVRAGGDVHVHVLPTITDEDEALEVLEKLETKNFRTIHNDNYNKRVPGSGMWFIESEILQDWAHGRGPRKILWVIGNAGVGKTVLASIVIAELEALERPSSEGTPGIALAYIYCRYTERMSVEDMLLAMVRQQLERNLSLAPLIKPLLDKHKREKTKPSQNELLEILNEISLRFETTYYVLDALDEAPHDVRFDIVQVLASVNARFFITSRPLGHLQRDFAIFATFTTLTAQKLDIDLLIDRAVGRNPGLRALIQENGLRDEVGSMIFQSCGGMFLHASLQLKSLSFCSNVDDLRRTLRAFPREIDTFYDQCFERIDRQSEGQILLAKAALTCLLSAQRDLTLEELQRAISYNPESRRFGAITSADHLVPLFCGLITIDTESTLVRFVHYTAVDTVKRHLERDPLHTDLHAHLASACIDHLAENDFQRIYGKSDFPNAFEIFDTLKRVPFLDYAYNHWSFHAHQSPSKSVKKLCADFIHQCQSFPCPSHPTIWLPAIHVAAYHNFPTSIQHLLAKLPALVNQGDSDGTSALCWAARRGHEAVLRVLLDAEGVAVNQGDNDGDLALINAAREGHTTCVRLLLDAGGIMVNRGNRVGDSALIVAARRGHEDCVRLLGAKGIAVNRTVKGRASALLAAAQGGNKEIVRLLLGVEGIAVNEVDANMDSALIKAAREGHKACLRLLLDAGGILVNHRNIDGDTALIVAARRGHEDCVHLLLRAKGIAVNQVDRNGDSALIVAARYGKEAVVRLLLGSEGILVSEVDEYRDSALIAAARRGHKACVRLLLGAEGIVVNEQGHNGDSALIAAAQYGHEACVRVLLQVEGIAINQVDDNGDSALILAAWEGYVGIVRLILDVGEIAVNQRNDDGDSALIVAARQGHEANVRLLVDAEGIDVNQVDGDGNSALVEAAKGGHEAVVRLLLDAEGIAVSEMARDGTSALVWAERNGHDAIADLLRDRMVHGQLSP